MPKIRVRIVRLPDDIEEWEHELLLDTPEMIISEFDFSGLPKPSIIKGRTVCENGYRGMLFEFVKEWYEIIKIWNPKGEFMGYYCNINRPPERFEGGYEAVDLFLDLWVFPDMEYVVLDEDELSEAVDKGLVDGDTKKKATEILTRLVNMVEGKNFPPRIVNEYD